MYNGTIDYVSVVYRCSKSLNPEDGEYEFDAAFDYYDDAERYAAEQRKVYSWYEFKILTKKITIMDSENGGK